ncbi:MAG: Holliday junction branch migration protein RuvA [Bacteroidia bacterium]|nr:MAG: Holliday junction branch migration protein RuvA [Bacteroidia bacterium]
MIAFIEGTIEEKNPAYLVVNCQGVGYLLHISLNTYNAVPDKGTARMLTLQVIREDAHTLFGFADKEERELFRHLISVSGVGPNTARMILSAMTPAEIKAAIVNNNISILQSIKGIGAKSAQRIIVDLKDRLEKEGVFKEENLLITDNTIQQEALSALVMLGFAKNSAQKAIAAILKKHQGSVQSAEYLVKEALKSF